MFLTPAIIGIVIAAALYFHAARENSKRKAAESIQFGILVAMLGVFLSVVWYIGPEGVEQIRVFMAPRVVVH